MELIQTVILNLKQTISGDLSELADLVHITIPGDFENLIKLFENSNKITNDKNENNNKNNDKNEELLDDSLVPLFVELKNNTNEISTDKTDGLDKEILLSKEIFLNKDEAIRLSIKDLDIKNSNFENKTEDLSLLKDKTSEVYLINLNDIKKKKSENNLIKIFEKEDKVKDIFSNSVKSFDGLENFKTETKDIKLNNENKYENNNDHKTENNIKLDFENILSNNKDELKIKIKKDDNIKSFGKSNLNHEAKNINLTDENNNEDKNDRKTESNIKLDFENILSNNKDELKIKIKKDDNTKYFDKSNLSFMNNETKDIKLKDIEDNKSNINDIKRPDLNFDKYSNDDKSKNFHIKTSDDKNFLIDISMNLKKDELLIKFKSENKDYINNLLEAKKDIEDGIIKNTDLNNVKIELGINEGNVKENKKFKSKKNFNINGINLKEDIKEIKKDGLSIYA